MSGSMEQFSKNKFYFVVGAASMVYGILKLFDKATNNGSTLEDDGDYYWEPVDENTDYNPHWDDE